MTVCAELRDVVHGLEQGSLYFQIVVRCHGTQVFNVISPKRIVCWEQNSGRQICRYHFTQTSLSSSRMQRCGMWPHCTDLSDGTCLSTLLPYARFGCGFSSFSHISTINGAFDQTFTQISSETKTGGSRPPSSPFLDWKTLTELSTKIHVISELHGCTVHQ